jgi:hypothetical protein
MCQAATRGMLAPIVVCMVMGGAGSNSKAAKVSISGYEKYYRRRAQQCRQVENKTVLQSSAQHLSSRPPAITAAVLLPRSVPFRPRNDGGTKILGLQIPPRANALLFYLFHHYY